MRLIPTSRRGTVWRFLGAAVIVVAATAATTAVAGLLQFKQLAADIGAAPAIKHARIIVPQPGHAQTILVIGSDHRIGEPFNAANTDTMMLVRLNPDSSTINVLSIPRDLQVSIPRAGTAKLNAAYSYGGPNLLIKVIRQQVFPNLQVNHIVDVNFGGFVDLVNAIGCVYTDVDHRYYNDTRVTNYSSINLQPGYGRLCGDDALSFVRFRHTDNDLVRNARQQDFIRWAKDQYGVDRLITNRDKLLRIFGKHTETDADLHSVDGLINLFNLVAFSAGHTIKQIKFPAVIQPCGGAAIGPGRIGPAPCYVTADHFAEEQTFAAFMRPTPGSPAKPAAPPSGGGGGPVAPVRHGGGIPTSGLTADPADAHGQQMALTGAGLGVYAPRLIASGSTYCSAQTSTCPVQIPSPESYPRKYQIHDQSGHLRPAYRITLALNPNLGEYYGIEGMAWENPPILAGTHDTVVVGGRTLQVYYNGHRVDVVAWHTHGEVVWVANTLTDDLSYQQMVGIAASLGRA